MWGWARQQMREVLRGRAVRATTFKCRVRTRSVAGSLGSQIQPIVDELGPIDKFVERRAAGTLCKGIPRDGGPDLIRLLVFRLEERAVAVNADFFAEAFDVVRRNDLAPV